MNGKTVMGLTLAIALGIAATLVGRNIVNAERSGAGANARMTEVVIARTDMEPGRLIAANAGVLVSRVTYVKEGEARKFLILDAGMNDLIRPAMYDAHHEIVSLREGLAGSLYDVVGPVCESSDLFGRDRRLPQMKDGDLVAILTAGAYGAVMASAYNARPPAAEVLVKGSEWAVVRPRMSDDELIGLDRIPGWLAP